jgi:hypothetical protein
MRGWDPAKAQENPESPYIFCDMELLKTTNAKKESLLGDMAKILNQPRLAGKVHAIPQSRWLIVWLFSLRKKK